MLLDSAHSRTYRRKPTFVPLGRNEECPQGVRFLTSYLSVQYNTRPRKGSFMCNQTARAVVQCCCAMHLRCCARVDGDDHLMNEYPTIYNKGGDQVGVYT